MSIWVNNWQIFYFQKVRGCTRRKNFFSTYIQKMRKIKLFRLVKIKFEKQVSRIKKISDNLTFEVWILVKKIKLNFFRKMHAHAIGGKFLFWLVPKMYKGNFFKLIRIRFGKQVYDLLKKVEKLTFVISI